MLLANFGQTFYICYMDGMALTTNLWHFLTQLQASNWKDL